MSNYKEMFERYNSELKDLYTQRTNNRERAELIIELSDNLLTKFRTFVCKQGFQHPKEEIDFFKSIKPQVMAQRIANSIFLDLHLKQKWMDEKTFENYKLNKINKLTSYFEEYSDFFNYVNSNNLFRDEHYFTLKATKNDITIKTLYTIDSLFDTGYDIILANMLAINLLREKTDDMDSFDKKPIPELKWTLQKYDLVELVLALHHAKAFNYGKSDLKEIAMAIGQIFNMNLNDINRAAFSVKNRKKESAKFLYDLASNLNRIILESNR